MAFKSSHGEFILSSDCWFAFFSTDCARVYYWKIEVP